MTSSTSEVPIGLQLYSVRGECQRGLPATLQAVARLGYRAVEPWGYDGSSLEWLGHPAAEVRHMLDDNSLQCCGLHLSTGALLGDTLQRTIELNQVLGNRLLIISADRERMGSRQGIAALADILNRASEQVQSLDMLAGYHAHGFDFVRYDLQTAWEILFSSTRQEVVMQLDIGNCAGGGGDPIATLEKFPGRARSIHLKEYGAPPGGVIGEGKADWKRIFGLCETLHHPDWYVVEEGGPEGLGFEVSGRSLAALRRMGK